MNARDIIQGFGGPGRLAAALNRPSQLVWRWQKRGIPASQVGFVSAVTGRAPHEIRPDLYPAPAQLRRPADAIERANDDAEQRGATMTRAPSRHRRDRRAA